MNGSKRWEKTDENARGERRRNEKEEGEEKVTREERRKRILDIVPLLKNGDRLVIYTAADARSALKISRTGVPAPDGFLYFSRLVSSLPPFFLLSSYFSSSPPCRFFYARLIYPSLRTASARTVRALSSISRDFSPISFVIFQKTLPFSHVFPRFARSIVPRTRCDIQFRRFIPAGYRVMSVSRLPEEDFWNARGIGRIIVC